MGLVSSNGLGRTGLMNVGHNSSRGHMSNFLILLFKMKVKSS